MSTSQREYKGMTVNERLFVSGLMDDFDRAVKEKNTKRAAEILQSLDIGQSNIEAVLVAVGLFDFSGGKPI